MQVLSRDELYERVWAEPMIKVAAELGVSGTALKKTCNRHDIPTPERGYWAKLAHGKPVAKEPLPKVRNGRAGQIRVHASPGRRLPPEIREAGDKARAAATATAPAPETQGPGASEPAALAAARKQARKAKPDGQGFVAVSGRGIVPMRIAPASLERAITLIGQLLRAVEAQGHTVQVTESGLVLIVDGEKLQVAVDEPPARTPHEPTAKELKLKADRERWGPIANTWPKYDHTPSGRLALVIQENDYSGLRRTFADRKTKPVEQTLPDFIAGLAEHAALKTMRRLEAEARAREAAAWEARRQREAAFKHREARRIGFIDLVDAQLGEREKLRRVLAHLQGAHSDERPRLSAMIAWLELRLRAIEALLGPVFLDISARDTDVEFDEAKAAAGPKGGDEYRYYSRDPKLQF